MPSENRAAQVAVDLFAGRASLKPMPRIPLEDNFDDVIRKAQRGLGLTDSELARRAGLDPAVVRELRGGTFDEAAVRAVAPILRLGADRPPHPGQSGQPMNLDLVLENQGFGGVLLQGVFFRTASFALAF